MVARRAVKVQCWSVQYCTEQNSSSVYYSFSVESFRAAMRQRGKRFLGRRIFLSQTLDSKKLEIFSQQFGALAEQPVPGEVRASRLTLFFFRP